MNRAGTALTGCRVNYGLAALGSRKAISTIPCVASSNFDAPGRALVSHRRSRLLLARWHNRVPRSSRQAGQSRRISHRAGRNRKRAQPAGGVKQATVLAIGEKKNAGGIRCSSRRGFCITDHRNPALPQAWHTLAGTLPCCAISPEISAEQVADFLQHRLLKLKPGHTAGADPLP